jgi:hypothetical protein
MATYTVITPDLDGEVYTLTAVAASDEFPNDGNTLLHVKNASGGSINVTITSVQNCDQGVNHPVVVAVGAGAEKFIGPFNPTRFNNPSTGRVTVGYSAQTSITAAAVRKA